MENIFIKLDVGSVRGGIIPKVGVKNFAILASIATFADSNGIAYPSQDTIGELTGYSRQTVNKSIKELRELIIDGEAVLTVTQKKSPSGIQNQYKLSANSGFYFGKKRQGVVKEIERVVNQDGQGVVNGALQEEEPTNNIHLELDPKNNNQKEIVFDNVKDILAYFQNKYFEKYNVTYSPNFARDCGLIKRKLSAVYTGEEIKALIDVSFRDYDKRWANPQFPRITLGQICSWLGNKALEIALVESKQTQAVEADVQKYEMDDSAWDSLMDKF